MAEEIVWTVLPNGRHNGKVRLTLYVSPRLTGGSRLDQFQLMRNWPAQLVDEGGNWKTQFKLHFGDHVLAATPSRESEGPRKTYRPAPELWAGLFPGDTFIEDFSFKDNSARRVHSFPAVNIKSFVDQKYRGAAAQSPVEPPRVETLVKDDRLRDISLFQPIQLEQDAAPTLFAPGGKMRDYAKLAQTESARIGRKVSADQLLMADVRFHVDEETDKLFTDPKIGRLRAVPPAAPNARSDFMQLKRFHVARTPEPVREAVEPPELDFHGMLTAYGQHPAVMRLLGLAIDLDLEGPAPANEGLVWVQVMPQHLQTKAPRTRFAFRADVPGPLGFAAKPKPDSDLESCCAGVGSKAFSVVHMDVNGAGEKAMKLAVDVQRSTLTRSADTQAHVALPALQTVGLSLIRTGAAQELVKRFDAQKVLNDDLVANKAVELWADDLLRGYRVDVLDGTSGTWRSVCRRRTGYRRTDQERAWFEDYEGNDGWVSTAVTESAEDDDDDLSVSESQFLWKGWSLVAPRPGNTLSKDYQSVPQESEAAQDLNLRISTEPSKGSLPRLRYGYPYKIRLRAVDLAGNSLTIEEANSLTQGELADKLVVGEGYVYRRLEPVAQPVVLAHDPLTRSNGESMERLVIRNYNYQPDLDAAPTKEITQRHILPTGTSQLMAEQHGQFDDAQGHPNPAAYQAIVGHDNPLPNKDGVYQQPSVPIPYLPDPAGRGAAFSGLPTAQNTPNRVTTHLGNGKVFEWDIAPPPEPAKTVHQVDFGPPNGWPKLQGFRLVIAGTREPQDPRWNAKNREFVVFMKPGEIRKVRLGSYVLEKDLEKFDAWDWLQQENTADKLKGQVLAGLHWMLTPHRELTLVHAVQQPLITPQFKNLRSLRRANQTWTTLADAFPIDGHSTLKLDINARWKDVDDTGAAPRIVDGQSYAFEYPVEYAHSQAEFGPKRTITRSMVNPRNLGLVDRKKLDTMRRAETTLEFQERKLDTSRSAANVSRTAGSQLKLSQIPKSGVQTSQISAAVAPKRPRRSAPERPVSRHEFGDTRYRRVAYSATATTRFLEYMPFYQAFKSFQKTQQAPSKGGGVVTRWEQQNPKLAFTRRSQPVAIDVLSSARPPAPEIEYVIPTFGWERRREGGTTTSRRSGGGLRVYLRRPWFASGAGELLGVVVGQPSRRASSNRRQPGMNALKPYITQWGMDPIWRSAPVPTVWTPSVKNFRNAAKTESNLTLEEMPEARVSVAGYVVGTWDDQGTLTGYDPDRQLWFCDIELDPGQSYFPFVRLALVRYQPNSVSWKGDRPGDVKLSRVVLTDFAQLAPDRFANVTFTAANRVKVTVTGHSYLESGVDKYGSHLKPQAGQRSSVSNVQGAASVQGQQTGVKRNMLDLTRALFPRSQGGGTLEVTLESAPSGEREVLAWRPEPDATFQLKRNAAQNAWSGDITLPEPAGGRRYRLVIKEFEWFMRDASEQPATGSRRSSLASRLVYADALEI